MFVIALAGNANCGKTTLFNLLTESRQTTGNRPGVTVELKSGNLRGRGDVEIVDLPGVTSLSPFTADEKIADDFLTSKKADLVIDVVNVTELERNLLLTSQLAELDVPMVVALNMSDEAKKRGIVTDADKLSQMLGVKCVEISAKNGNGVESLTDFCLQKRFPPKKTFDFGKTVESALEKISADGSDKRRQTIKMLEQTNRQIAVEITALRFERIRSIVDVCQNEVPPLAVSKLDKIVLNGKLAPICFVAVTFVTFYLAMGKWAGGLLSDGLAKIFSLACVKAQSVLGNGAVARCVVEAVIGGVATVVTFVPQIMILFGAITFLEESGYMTRVAFVADGILENVGLSGKSFVAMLLGVGCTVPAVTATRTVKNEKERQTAITVAPFVPCSAKLSVISFFAGEVFADNRNKAVLFATSFYVVALVVIVIVCLIAKTFAKNDDEGCFAMQLPPYRLPSARAVWRQMAEKGKAFVKKAGSVILITSVVTWMLTNLDAGFCVTENASESLLALLGKKIAPLLTPLGFGKWQFAVATLSGLLAKETAISSLKVTLGSVSVTEALGSVAAVYSFVTYNLLTVPCVSAVATVFAEKGSAKATLSTVAVELVTSYLVSLTMFQVFSRVKNTALSVLIVTAVATVVILALSCACARKNDAVPSCKSCENFALCKGNDGL